MALILRVVLRPLVPARERSRPKESDKHRMKMMSGKLLRMLTVMLSIRPVRRVEPPPSV